MIEPELVPKLPEFGLQHRRGEVGKSVGQKRVQQIPGVTVTGRVSERAAQVRDFAATVELLAIDLVGRHRRLQHAGQLRGQRFGRCGRNLPGRPQLQVEGERERRPELTVGLRRHGFQHEAGEIGFGERKPGLARDDHPLNRVGDVEQLLPRIAVLQPSDVPRLPVQGEQSATVNRAAGEAGVAVRDGQKQSGLPLGDKMPLAGFLCQSHPCGVDAERGPVEHGEPPARQPRAACPHLRFQRHKVAAEIRRLGAEQLESRGRAGHQGRDIDRELMAAAKLVGQQHVFVGLAEVAPVRHLDQKAKPVRERRVERLGPEINFAGGLIIRRWGIHGRPAVAEFFQLHPLHPFFVDDGKELVLQVRPGAVQFVNEDHLGLPDGRGGADVVERGLLRIGHRNAHEIVVVHERGVVEAVGQPEGLGQPLQQKTLRGAVLADQQQGLAGRQRREEDGLKLVPTEEAQGLGQKC